MTNKIEFIDFHPDVLEKSFWGNKKYESIESLMKRVNEWVRKNYNREIINIETVQTVTAGSQSRSSSSSRIVTGGGSFDMVQFVRLWYK